jgi:hypothetical protein
MEKMNINRCVLEGIGKSATTGTDWFESAKLWALDNKKESVLAIGGALIGGRLL